MLSDILSPLNPSNKTVFPFVGRSAFLSNVKISFSEAASKIGQAQKIEPSSFLTTSFPSHPFLAAHPRCVSNTCPTFIREGTPSGLKIISTGVPSAI